MPLAAQRHKLLGTERPYPGQLWRRECLRVMIVTVGPSTVTYDNLGRALNWGFQGGTISD